MTVREQRRGRTIAMSPDELNDFLAAERTCRVATSSPQGPHNTPLWFVWDGTALWLTSIVKSQRWTDLRRDPRVAVLIDAGETYDQLRGAELRGTVEVVGEVPRTGEDSAPLAGPELLMARKYFGSDTFHHDGRHAWLRLVPEKITSWDFRKLAPGHGAPHGEQAWDERYRAKPEVWSGKPNEVLVAEVTALKPGTALDAGAGEGGDAFWLASQGWTVTAADISSVAIERASGRAARLGADIAWLRADLAKTPAPGTYDLVTAHFLHVPKADQGQLFRNLAAAVAPGGTLLVVGHDLSDMGKTRRPDLTELGWAPGEVAAVLGDGWTIEVAQARPRQATSPDGDEITVHDAILRARRDA